MAPILNLPLRVGVAFVPEAAQTQPHASWNSYGTGFLPETEKQNLLEAVVGNFRSLPFVQSIQIVPTPYLTPGGGFANLDQLKSLYGLDVMVLVSFDQVQFTDEGIGSLLYWTLVGAYIVPAEKNATATLLDAAVFDLASRSLLFRAPGISHRHGLSTPINLSEELRTDSFNGFHEAATNLGTNLKQELVRFEQRIKDRPSEIQIVRREGYRGASGGSETWWELSIFAGISLLALYAKFDRGGVRTSSTSSP